ncbi:type I phosphomannose isomerase catalytic subunit [Lacticaseibacillus zhaodongensis]|uniref:type I phosphomannose isomerase catalytic subunit n=1 Tax=Lacticaseibacillus zhaodongensis TaxID=2668065 RepID=UPI0012D34CEE|nr:type I phosphomannose isomerase catalytic subunit [Lacticaseibacillus zhaodongensis]
MHTELMFFRIIPRHAIWGGPIMHNYFGYNVPAQTGQAWVFSAHKDFTNVCQNGDYRGQTLAKIWDMAPELFRSKYEHFPFVVSLVAPAEQRSVQVHPTDAVAQAKGFPHGKSEAWVILQAPEDGKLIYGSNSDVKTTTDRITKEDFAGLFREIPVHTGDAIYIPDGTIHGLGAGNIAYQIQQVSDHSYRIYDYGRSEVDGSKRPTAIRDAVDSINSAPEEYNTTLRYVHPDGSDILKKDSFTAHEYIGSSEFYLSSMTVHGHARMRKQSYWLCTVVKGTGRVNGHTVRFADNFIIPATVSRLELRGNFTLMISSEKRIINV